MKLKIAIPTTLLAGLVLATAGFAASGTTVHTGANYSELVAGAKSINCYIHASDVCIANNSNQTVYFNVPLLQQAGPLSPPQWVDVYSNYVYPSMGVVITNSYGQQIFNQPVPNHSVINVGNNTNLASGKNGKKLKVTVSH